MLLRNDAPSPRLSLGRASRLAGHGRRSESRVTMATPETTVAPVLIVDDDPAVRQALAHALALLGLAAEEAGDAPEAVTRLSRLRPSLVLLDLSLAASAGETVAAALRARYGAAVPIVVLSASSHAAERADAIGAYDYLRKPFDLPQLLDTVRHAVAR